MVTIREVSELAKVSTSTVSRVVSKNGIVSEETRERVLKAIKTLGYQPNTLAQGLKNNRSNIIGVVVPDLSSPYFAFMLRGVEQAVERANMKMIVSSGHADKKAERKAVESMLGHRCDALILHMEVTLSDTIDEISALIRNQVPIVSMGRYIPSYADQSVYLDNELGGFLATEHLISQGHEDIIHLTGSLTYSDSRTRLDGYKKAYKKADNKFKKERILEGDYTEEFGYETTYKHIKEKTKFTAIFAGDDDIAAGVLEALRDHNIKVPQEVSVVGFDDMFYARLMHPKLTTVKQPIIEMGEAAGELAINLIAGREDKEVKRIFKPELKIRDSVRNIR